MTRKIGVGIVGVQPGRSWAAVAHIPALRALGDRYEIVGIANTSAESGRKAAEETGIARAFADVDELVASPEVRLVAICVKVPHHAEIVRKAFAAGKDVYCEWPIGNGLAEARELVALADGSGRHGFAGTQARLAPAIRHVRELVESGYVGTVLSSTLIGSGMNWGAMVDQPNAYTYDVTNGATLLTIPFGHTAAALADVLGPVASVSAVLATRRTTARNVTTGEDFTPTAPDQVVVAGVLESGAPLAIHYRGGMPRGTGLLWEVNGTDGDLQITAIGGHAQLLDLTVSGATGQDEAPAVLPLPEALQPAEGLGAAAQNVAAVYRAIADDLADGGHRAPTFADALRTHRLIAAIEQADRTGARVDVASV